MEDRFVRQYQTENCALISNNIHTIVPRADGTLLLGTENSVALFRRESGTFRNWTAEQGLASVCLNAGVSTFRHGESFVFGSNTGAVMFPSDMRIPAPHFSRMLLRDFMISYRPVYPGDKGSPLREDIDNTVRLELAYNQNTSPWKLSPSTTTIPRTSYIHGNWRGSTRLEPSGPERADTVHEPAPRQLHPAYPCRLQ